MDFELSGKQREIKDRAAEFADRELAPFAADFDAEDRVPFEALGKMADAGFMGLCVPEEYGGAGMDFVSYCILIEEFSRADAGVGATLAVHTSAGTLPVVMFGTEEQKARWVPPLARGESIGCFALTEPETGSDASAIGARARRLPRLGAQAMGHQRAHRRGHDPLRP
jgi:alkylation response protein AidB-like acyl-CoA dehydrogenase